MTNHSKPWLQTLFWEIKNRFFHFCFSFTMCLFVCYQYSQSLLYLLVLSCAGKENIFQKIENTLLFKDVKDFFILIKNNIYHYQDHASDFSLFLRKMDKEELDNLCNILESSNNYIIKFIFTNVEEAFSSTLVICFVFSLLAIIPYFIYVFLSFLAPILFLHDRKKLLFYFINFFVLWALFNIALQNEIIPIFAEFFVDFNINDSGFHVLAETKIYCYCIWSINIFMKANLILSVFCFFICLIFNNKVEIKVVLSQRKTCFLIILIVSAFLSPPDLIYQSFLAFVLTICFQGLIYLFFVYTAFTKLFLQNKALQ